MDREIQQKLIIQKFIELFQGRQDLFAIQLQDGRYVPKEAEYSVNVILEHLAGRRTVGIYPIKDNMVKFTCIDLDEVNTDKVNQIKQAIEVLGISSNEYLIEFSGNKGYHFWVFYSDWVKAKYALALGRVILAKAGLDNLEIFPKQESVNSEYRDQNGKLNTGNLIKLPLGIHVISKKRSETLDYNLNPKATRLLEIKQIPETRLIEILKANYTVYESKRIEKLNNTVNNRACPCFVKMQFGTDQGDRDEVAFTLATHCFRNGIDEDLAYKLLQSWDERNNPMLGNPTLLRKVKSAYEGKYSGLRCEKTFMKKYCSDRCKLRKNRQKVQDINILIPQSGFVHDFVDFAVECTDAPVQFHLMSAFMVLSTALNGNLWFEFGNEIIKPNLWAILVAPSSSFRKTSSINIARSIISEFEPLLIFPKEFTGERLLEILACRGQGIFFFSEFASFLGQLNKSYMAGVKELLTDLFDCKDDPSPQRSTKGGGDIYIREPFINMYAATTLDWVTGKVTEDDVMSGFFPRWLMMPAARKTMHYGIPPKMDKIKKNNLVRYLINIASLNGEVDLSAIKQRYDEWSNALSIRISGLSPKLQPFLARYEIYALKIALLYEASYNQRLPLQISMNSLEYAISFIEFLFKEVTEIIESKMAFSQFERDRQKVIELIDRTGVIARSILIRHSHMLSNKLDEVINTLIAEGTIEIENQQGGGPLLYKMRETV